MQLQHHAPPRPGSNDRRPGCLRLQLLHRSDGGVRSEVNSLDRAVVLLGFDAVRSAVLAISVFETFATTGAFVNRGVEIQLELGVRHDDGTDIAADHHDLAVRGDTALQREDRGADLRMSRDWRDELIDTCRV